MQIVSGNSKSGEKHTLKNGFISMIAVWGHQNHLLEVAIYDYEPAALMMFYHLFQEGCKQKKEIDMMTDDERSELYRKRLTSLYLLGQSFRKTSC